MKIPGTAKEIVRILTLEYKYSIKKMAAAIGVTPKTIYQILNGERPNRATDFALLRLYISLKLQAAKKKPGTNISRLCNEFYRAIHSQVSPARKLTVKIPELPNQDSNRV